MTTYDIAMYQTPTTSGSFYVPGLAIAGNYGRKITGVEKLAQRFVLELMTEQGSIPFKPDRGSEFMVLLRRGGLLNEGDVFSAFNTALQTVMDNFQTEDLEDDPLEEKLAGAEVLSIEVADNAIKMKIQLRTQAAVTGLLTIPLELTPSLQDIMSG